MKLYSYTEDGVMEEKEAPPVAIAKVCPIDRSAWLQMLELLNGDRALAGKCLSASFEAVGGKPQSHEIASFSDGLATTMGDLRMMSLQLGGFWRKPWPKDFYLELKLTESGSFAGIFGIENQELAFGRHTKKGRQLSYLCTHVSLDNWPL